jgi:hypothetical protein
MIVYVVMRDDGNVCCPVTELDSLWSNETQAKRRVSIIKSTGTSAHVEERQVDAEIVGL